MGDYTIQMQFDVAADEAALRQAISTAAGIRSWWTNHAELSGGKLQTSFVDTPMPFEFDVRDGPDGRIDWVTGAFPPPWAGTTVSWDFAPNPDGPGTRLQFRHGGFDANNPVIPVVTPVWAQIGLRLKDFAESGTPNPFFAY